MTRFMVNRSEGKLMGVCAGLADMTGTDPIWWRIGAVVGTVVTGFWPIPVVYGVAGWLGQRNQ
jgi:phage shock protein C